MHKIKIVLLAGQLALGALDSHSTRVNIQNGGIENNPIGRPFVHSNALYATNAGLSVGLYYVGRKLEKKHKKLSFVPQVVDLAGHAKGWMDSR